MVAGQRSRRNFAHFGECRRTVSLPAATMFDCSEVRYPVSSPVKIKLILAFLIDGTPKNRQPLDYSLTISTTII